MKYSISREQQFFFEQKRYIEFDGLLSDAEQKSLFEAVKNTQNKMRDLSYISEPIKTITHMSRLAKLASELTHVRHLRFGFDQILQTPQGIANFASEVCITGLVCLLYISIDPKDSNCLFALATVDTAELPLNPEKSYFVVGWATSRAQYILQPKDLYTHELKRLGYVFGDRLKEEWHPTLIR